MVVIIDRSSGYWWALSQGQSGMLSVPAVKGTAAEVSAIQDIDFASEPEFALFVRVI